ncbi:MAG: glycogen/starch synthase, partial [Muribaculaceae bacterium]|nr:glycogen/starch synthase [Muribaculaceae bacterium]
IETVRKLGWDPAIIHCGGWVTALAPLYMRNLYGDEPSFRDAKIVYSLFDNDFEQPLDSRLADKLRQDGIDEEALAPLLDKQVTQLELTKVALAHADAVTQCSPDIKPEIMELVKQSGLPFLPYQEPETLSEAYWQFYNSL